MKLTNNMDAKQQNSWMGFSSRMIDWHDTPDWHRVHKKAYLYIPLIKKKNEKMRKIHDISVCIKFFFTPFS